MVINKIVNATQLDADLTDIADAIREKGGTSAALDFPDDFVSAVQAIPSGGAAITDGIVIKARDANGYATEVDFYGTIVQMRQFYNRVATDGGWISLQRINFKDAVTEIKNYAFYCCGALNLSSEQLASITSVGAGSFNNVGAITALVMPNLTSINQESFIAMAALETAHFPKLVNCNYARAFRSCKALQSVTLGSIGYAVTAMSNLMFMDDTQTGLTITVFTTGDRADTIVTNIRNSATAATIVIKAAEATTYNGTSYAAGDTILTSEVA